MIVLMGYINAAGAGFRLPTMVSDPKWEGEGWGNDHTAPILPLLLYLMRQMYSTSADGRCSLSHSNVFAPE